MMSFLEFFRRSRKKSASVARDRLQIIVARERASTSGEIDYLPELQRELLAVVAKFERIDMEQVSVNVDNAGDCDVLELNIVLPDSVVQRDRGHQLRVATPLPS